MKRINLLKYLPLAALITLSACVGESGKDNQTEIATRNVIVEEVSLTPVDQKSSFTASVEANTVNHITPAMGGRIREIHADVGSRVSKGQKMVTMDATNFSQQETQLATLQRDYDRFSELFNVGGVSKQQLDQMKTQLDVAQSALNNIRENTGLVSPIDGIVTARNYDPGDVVAGIPILTIENVNPAKIVINVSESYYSKVSKGMPATIIVDALEGEIFNGKISLIHPTINPMSRTFPIEIEVNNSDLRLRPGMFSRVELNFGTNERPLVTDLAVMKQTGSNDRFVFVEKEGKAVYTKVELGIRIDDKYEILSGLNGGERVIVQGNSGLIEGSAVEIVE